MFLLLSESAAGFLLNLPHPAPCPGGAGIRGPERMEMFDCQWEMEKLSLMQANCHVSSDGVETLRYLKASGCLIITKRCRNRSEGGGML